MSAQENPPSSGTRSLLLLELPLAREEALLDVLQQCPELHQGYTVLAAQGMGSGAVLATVMEQVQGRARRIQVQAVVDQAAVGPMLARLRSQLPTPDVMYRVLPLLDEGRLA